MKKGSIKEEIIKLRQEGLSINKISDILGCAKSTISYHINKVGLGGKTKNFLTKNEINDEVIKEIINLRLKSKTYEEILCIINISRDKLKKICRDFKLNTSSNIFKSSFLEKEDVIKYYKEVKSLRKTAIFFNVSRETIKKKLEGENIIKKEKRKTVSQSVTDWRKRKKIDLVKYKGGKCQCCDYNKSLSALQFHHIDPTKKDFNIGSKNYSFERLKNEVDKCILVCSNCHLEIHEEIRNIGYSEKIKNIAPPDGIQPPFID